MKTASTNQPDRVAVPTESIIMLPLGLLGFEVNKRYVLLADTDEAPFMWLQMLEEPKQAFLVMPPSIAMPEYRPDLSLEDVEFLGLRNPDDAMIVNIVTVRGPNQATMNLKGPVVVNRLTLLAKQVIPVNAADYDLRHPLDTTF